MCTKVSFLMQWNTQVFWCPLYYIMVNVWAVWTTVLGEKNLNSEWHLGLRSSERVLWPFCCSSTLENNSFLGTFRSLKKKKKRSTSEASGNRMASDWCSFLPQTCSVWVRDAWRLSGPQQLTSGITWEEDAGSHLSVQVQKRLSKKSGPEGWLSIIGYTLLPALRKETDSSLEVNRQLGVGL